jgi:hypothetical protein
MKKKKGKRKKEERKKEKKSKVRLGCWIAKAIIIR